MNMTSAELLEQLQQALKREDDSALGVLDQLYGMASTQVLELEISLKDRKKLIQDRLESQVRDLKRKAADETKELDDMMGAMINASKMQMDKIKHFLTVTKGIPQVTDTAEAETLEVLEAPKA